MITLSSCGSKSSTRQNPLLESSWDTPHGVAPFDKIMHSDYMPALEIAIEEQNQIIETIISDSTELTFEGVILALDNSDIKIADIFNIFTMVEAANSSPEFAEVNSRMMPRLSAQQDRVLLDANLFDKIKGVYDLREELGLDREQLRLVKRTYDKFVRGGALLDEESRARLSAINEEIAGLRVRFSQNLVAENNSYTLELKREQLGGLPNSFRDIALREAKSRGVNDRWVITLQQSSIIPFLTYSSMRNLREEIYNAYINRGRNSNEYDNREIVASVTKLRDEKSKLLGYENFAEYVTSQQMAKNPEAAYELLEEVWTLAIELSEDEHDRMKKALNREHKNVEFEAWDWWYYAEDVRSKEYSLRGESLQNYFSVEGVRNGAFLLANRLYGVTFRPIVIPQYADGCMAYEAIDVDGSILGVLHMDLYARPTKGQGAWCGFLREQRYEDGERVLPIVSVSCNFARPKDNSRTLLSTREVETLFHEFGHALHFLFQDVKYRGLSDVEGDFVELPSQIMENWAFEPELLRLYAVNYNGGEVIPEKFIKDMMRSRLFNQGFLTLEVTSAALLDLDLHTQMTLDEFEVDSFEMRSWTKSRQLPSYITPRYRLAQFSHLFTFDYASGYYFYMWAEVLDKDAFEAFKRSGDIFNRELAERFRREILERGGSEDGEVMYRNFRGANPSREALLVARGLMEPPVEEEEIFEEELPEENEILEEDDELPEEEELVDEENTDEKLES